MANKCKIYFFFILFLEKVLKFIKPSPRPLFATQKQNQEAKSSKKVQKQRNPFLQLFFHSKPKEAKKQLQDQIPKTKSQSNKKKHQRDGVLHQKVQNHTHKLFFFPNQDVVVLVL
jgi:hypothetical protein